MVLYPESGLNRVHTTAQTQAPTKQ